MGELYHEQQRLLRCALHTLNNLFQEPAFTKEKLDHIARTLAPGSYVNPHKNFFGLGNYDINVIIAALQSKGYTIQWWDRRKDVSTIPFGDIFGIIVNYVTIKWFGMWESRHWFPMRPINNNKNINNFNNDNTNDSNNNNNVSDNGENNNNNNNNIWYSFDSNLSSPRPFPPDLKEMIAYLSNFIANKRGEILLVVKDEEPKSG